MFGEEDTSAGRGPVSLRSLGVSLALHAVVILFFAYALNLFNRTPDVVIPIDMTIVPPWAEVDPDDPEPDPNPPPPPEPPKPKPKPQPKPQPKPEPVKNVEAVEKVVEKKKPPEKKPPEKVDLRKNATLIKDAPKPPEKVDLRKNATKITPPPPRLPPGKGTAAEKPLSAAEIQKLLDQGYRYGSRNELASSEEQRCMSVISAAIRREWDKENFSWNPGLSSINVLLQLGPGGTLRGFRILSGSGDPEVDRTVTNALRRLTRIPGLSATFLERHAEIAMEMKPVQAG